MLPVDTEVAEVVVGEGGVLEHTRPGRLLIDMNTVSPRTAVQLAVAAREREGASWPRQSPAAKRVRSKLRCPSWSAARPRTRRRPVKAANQLIVAVNIQALAEAVVFLEKAGADLPAALTVLGGGLAGSTVLNRKKANMLSRDFTSGFRIDLHQKDLGIVTDTARDIGAVLPVCAGAGH